MFYRFFKKNPFLIMLNLIALLLLSWTVNHTQHVDFFKIGAYLFGLLFGPISSALITYYLVKYKENKREEIRKSSLSLRTYLTLLDNMKILLQCRKPYEAILKTGSCASLITNFPRDESMSKSYLDINVQDAYEVLLGCNDIILKRSLHELNAFLIEIRWFASERNLFIDNLMIYEKGTEVNFMQSITVFNRTKVYEYYRATQNYLNLLDCYMGNLLKTIPLFHEHCIEMGFKIPDLHQEVFEQISGNIQNLGSEVIPESDFRLVHKIEKDIDINCEMLGNDNMRMVIKSFDGEGSPRLLRGFTIQGDKVLYLTWDLRGFCQNKYSLYDIKVPKNVINRIQFFEKEKANV